MDINQSQETIYTRDFPRGNHKGEKPTTSSEIEWAPNAKVKPKDTKMIYANCSLSHLFKLLLSHSCASVEWVCVPKRESHSLFILVFHLNFTLTWSTSIGESNNPYMIQLLGLLPWLTMEVWPQLNCADYFFDLQWRVNLNEFTWLYYINDSPDQRNKHLRRGKMKYNKKYTSEYILKLQIHQQFHVYV